MPHFGFLELLILGLIAAFGLSLLAVLAYVVYHALGGARRRD